jgi:hypothetical protein
MDEILNKLRRRIRNLEEATDMSEIIEPQIYACASTKNY